MYPRAYGDDPTPPQGLRLDPPLPRGHRRSGDAAGRRLVTPIAIGVAVAVVLGLGGVGWGAARWLRLGHPGRRKRTRRRHLRPHG